MSMKLAEMIYIGSFIAAGVFLVAFFVLYFVFDIKLILSILSGEKQKKELKRIREENRRKNNAFVNSLYKPSEQIEEVQEYGEQATTYLGNTDISGTTLL